MDALRDQDNQDKSDLQGKIQFYQKLCFIYEGGITERKSQAKDHCQFSTFKSSPTGRAVPDVASLDLTGLNLGHRDTVAPSRAGELNSSLSRDYYPSMERFRERNPNASSRQLDKQSYLFHGHKTEKDVDHEAVLLDRDTPDEIKFDYAVDDVAASVGSMNCFGGEKEKYGGDHEKKRKGKAGMLPGRRLDELTHDSRRDSGNVEFLEKEGEIFKKTSNELKKRKSSFNNKEKTHKSVESLERSVDFSQKSKSMDSSANKPRKRPNFFQRVFRSWHFLHNQRIIYRRNKYERPQTVEEKCEYFLQKFQESSLRPISLLQLDSICQNMLERYENISTDQIVDTNAVEQQKHRRKQEQSGNSAFGSDFSLGPSRLKKSLYILKGILIDIFLCTCLWVFYLYS